MKKRFMAALLTLCMLFALVPVTALAAETDTTAKIIEVYFRDGRYDVTRDEGVVSTRKIVETDSSFPAPAATEKDGYTFKGWSWESTEDGTNGDASHMLVDTDYSFASIEKKWPNDTIVTVYAVYEKNAPAQKKTLNVVFRDAPYWETGDDGVFSAREIDVNYGEFPAPTAEVLPVKDGYKFAGWTTEYNIATSLYTGEFEYNAMLKAGLFNAESDTSVTFYALYEEDTTPEPVPTKTIHLVFRDGRYDVTGDNGVVSTRDIDKTDGYFPVPTAEVMEKEGYTFKGWSWESTEDGTNGDASQMLVDTDCSFVSIEKKWPNDTIVTVYAVYEKNAPAQKKTLNVVFRDAPYWETGDDGVFSAREIDVNYGEFPAPTAEVLPVKDGYKFAGWVSEFNDASTLYTGKFEYNAMLEAGLFNAESDVAVTFYAYYEAIPVDPVDPVKPVTPTEPTVTPKPAAVQTSSAKVDEHPEIGQAIKDGTWGKNETVKTSTGAAAASGTAAARVPQTGDTANPVLWVAVMAAALAAFAAVVVLRRRGSKG